MSFDTINMPVISLFYAGLLGVLYLVLAYGVIVVRRRERVGIGHGDSKALAIAVRIHGNFAEYVPFLLLMLLMMELVGANPILLHALGAGLFIGRILHALGLKQSAGTSVPRFVGMLLTFVVLLFSVGYLIGFAIARMWGG